MARGGEGRGGKCDAGVEEKTGESTVEVRNHGRRAHTGDVLAILPEARSKRMIIFFYGEIDAAKGLLV